MPTTLRLGRALIWCAIAGVGTCTAEQLPWEVWKDPGAIARVPPGVRTVMSSSACPGRCQFDRHSPDAPKFIRSIGDEGVIFETGGSGAITRIWMTQGDRVSRDLDPEIAIRITIDGEDEPILDLPAAEFFAGTTGPFSTPMVLDRQRSGGGYVSLAPIPFRRGCRVSLVGAKEATIWYQVTAVLVDEAYPVVSFSPDADLTTWRRMLRRPGSDPWPHRGWPTISGSQRLKPGESVSLASFSGPDLITALILRAPSGRWPEVELRLSFDGHDSVALPVTWFFGVSGPQCLPVRSLFIGVNDGDLYSYFPMPFFDKAEVEVHLLPTAEANLDFEFAVRRAGEPPAEDAGLFFADLIDVPPTEPGTHALLADIDGRGRFVGLSVTAGIVEGRGWAFLEGDETIVVDGEDEPSWRGTGVEDFFSGGFYFRDEEKTPQPFRRALHGFTCVGGTSRRPSASLYRLLPTDGPVFDRSFQLWEEGGPTGDLPVRWRGVYWGYLRPAPQ